MAPSLRPTLNLSSYEGVVFDCDGTLVDSMPLHYVAWSLVLKKYGLVFPEDRFYKMGGISTEKTAAILAAEAGIKIDPVRVSQEKDAAFLLHLTQIKPIQRTVAVAQKAYGVCPLAVATGATLKLAQAELLHTGLSHLFKTIVAAEDVKHHKPSPDVYLEAARRLGVDPRRCLAFEDTEIGLQAARSAGMEAIHVDDIPPV